ncbi:MAG: Wzz/FepE/Etk N-terminal domain-containing protein [Gemmatimonadales bacterium]|jgi:uncharacterized protein involved in exopolysaccharide biosynthesis
MTQSPETVTASTAVERDEEVEEISLLELANVLLKRWKLVAGLPLLAALLAAIVSLLIPPKYTATATFVPEEESQALNLPSGIAGLAAQFGVAVPGGGANSPAFYADVLESRTLSDAVLLARFADPRSDVAADSAPLLEILDIDGDSESERLENGREELDEAVSVRVDNETSIVGVAVETRYPVLSAAVANLYIALVSRFNLETRQSNAQERRRFVEDRMAEAEQELRDAEEALQSWLERNRQWSGSPELQFQHDRLERQVTIKQEVFTTLRRSYEEARIQEVNDTPVITVIDRAVPPDEKSSPKRKLNVILAFFLGGVLSVFGAFGREFAERARERDQEEYEEFTSHWSAIKSEVKSLVTRRHRREG